ncbi:MAG: hypothetical protein HQL82_07745, partial [Magnetococcales bacterium]|nr:hypothetical protein [Magnetococcales bacterium]
MSKLVFSPMGWLLRSCLGVLVLLVLLAILLFGSLQSPPARQAGVALLNRLLASDGIRVVLGPQEGLLPCEVHLESLTLADAQGPWLTIQDLDWSLSRAALLEGRLVFQSLTA